MTKFLFQNTDLSISYCNVVQSTISKFGSLDAYAKYITPSPVYTIPSEYSDETKYYQKNGYLYEIIADSLVLDGNGNSISAIISYSLPEEYSDETIYYCGEDGTVYLVADDSQFLNENNEPVNCLVSYSLPEEYSDETIYKLGIDDHLVYLIGVDAIVNDSDNNPITIEIQKYGYYILSEDDEIDINYLSAIEVDAWTGYGE